MFSNFLNSSRLSSARDTPHFHFQCIISFTTPIIECLFTRFSWCLVDPPRKTRVEIREAFFLFFKSQSVGFRLRFGSRHKETRAINLFKQQHSVSPAAWRIWCWMRCKLGVIAGVIYIRFFVFRGVCDRHLVPALRHHVVLDIMPWDAPKVRPKTKSGQRDANFAPRSFWQLLTGCWIVPGSTLGAILNFLMGIRWVFGVLGIFYAFLMYFICVFDVC